MSTKIRVEVGANLFENLPEHGTILTVLDAKEVQDLKEINTREYAVRLVHANAAELEHLNEEKRIAWATLLAKHDIPYVWPVAIDYETGTIYVDNPKK